MAEDLTEIRIRALKVPNPQFLIDRLKGRKEALILSGASHDKLVGMKFILVNEILKKGEPALAFGRVSFTQEPKKLKSAKELRSRAAGVDPIMLREFQEREAPLFVLKLKLLKAFAKPRELGKVPPGRFSSVIEFTEAFHIRNVHWVPVPDSGECPASHPNKLKSPEDGMRCYTDSAADALRGSIAEQERPSLKAQTYILSKERFETKSEADKWMDDNDVPRPKVDETETSFRYRQFPPDQCQENSQRTTSITDGVQIVGCRLKPEFLEAVSEQAEKLTNERANLREANPDNPTERCKFCKYFSEPTTCQIIDGPVAADQVCDWVFSRETDAGLYKIEDENWLAFVQGMIDKQPYQHIVRDGAITPAGPLVMIEDTADPPHRFSLDKEFHVKHTSLEHHWTQAEVDALIDVGEKASKT